MGWHSRVTKVLDCDDMMYAVGQGALAVECRENNIEILNLLQPLHDPDTLLKVVAERSFLKTLGRLNLSLKEFRYIGETLAYLSGDQYIVKIIF